MAAIARTFQNMWMGKGVMGAASDYLLCLSSSICTPVSSFGEEEMKMIR